MTQLTYKQQVADRSGPLVVKALQKRGFDAYYCANREQAIEKALALVPAQDLLAWGGSATLDESGIKAAFLKRGNPVIDRDQAKTPDEKAALTRQALLCDTFLMSANAISADGQLVNIDGTGNRVAALCYGPKNVLVVAGFNKIVPTLDSALLRARHTAAPLNSMRFPSDHRPCYQTGQCADCLHPDTICAQIVLTRVCKPAGRIKVIIVGEDFGM
ncbi:MAG: lactate utilization protein [Clostridiales bacterium]|nr:lactate utilization protein [Clostridiales bacterium]